MSSPIRHDPDDEVSTSGLRRPLVYMLPVTDDAGEKMTLLLDEEGLAEYRRTHPPRPLEEIIGSLGMSDEEWEAFLRWEDERKRETRPTPPLDEEFPELFQEP